MIKTRDKLKRGGMDTIVAYIVVMIPLVYVLVFMIATLYHYTIQMSINQTVKETLIMASSYGTVTRSMIYDYMAPKMTKLVDGGFEIQFYVRELKDDGTVGTPVVANFDGDKKITYKNGQTLEKGDLLGIAVQSNNKSVLGSVSAFSLFGSNSDENNLYYSAYREEIIRNERNEDTP
ncbi:MAG: hypothetical protein J6M02_04870 [Clostridia bacterium]|nr:hypothetical protein [Clostridia bacterium]